MWLFNGLPFDDSLCKDYVGFVYSIHNVTKDKYYIGKKAFFKKIKRPPLKGKTKKRSCTVASDWLTYTGSSNKLNEDIASGDVIVKTILKLCTSKASLAYWELKQQLHEDSLFKDNYYNQIINIRLSSVCNKNILKDAD